VLYIHGATFPAENSIFFKLGGASWADALNSAGFSVWGLDFAGFGRSESYPEMSADAHLQESRWAAYQWR
jgi:alpha-beta hydrolase superfamily lysophospholipase